ncbi:MAG: release factor glutamine methyltransferase [Thiomicrorhabdus sp.]|nr:MAG: release factor glutamine methyltransferase [Thiomicrorhabdus sp.]
MNQPLDIQTTLQAAQLQLIEVGLTDSPRLDTELLLAHALQESRTHLFTWPDKLLNTTQTAKFQTLLELRLQGQPIAHILGEREFWGLNLKITQDTLIPRPDTETIVDAVLALHSQHKNCASNKNEQGGVSILDLGTGSGAIALALKSELNNATVTAVDFSEKALKVAIENASTHKLAINFLKSDWFSAIDSEQRFNYIVSNPPYIEAADPHLQQGDIRFEPITALTAGEDGLEDIRQIVQQGKSHLTSSGWLLIEHGFNQAESVANIFSQNGFLAIHLFEDLGGNPRITIGQKA